MTFKEELKIIKLMKREFSIKLIERPYTIKAYIKIYNE